MAPGIQRLHHVGISVPDLPAAKAFYCGVLGMSIVHSRPWSEGDARMDTILGLEGSSGERALLQGFGAQLELWFFRTPPTDAPPRRTIAAHGISHLCFEVADLHGLHARLLDAGVQFLSAPSTGPTGSVAVYGRDPFGNHLEFFQPPAAV